MSEELLLLVESIKRDIKRMEKIIETTTNIEDKYYYYGKIDGISGMLDLLVNYAGEPW